MRGGNSLKRWRMPPPLTLALSPQKRGEGTAARWPQTPNLKITGAPGVSPGREREGHAGGMALAREAT
jgi:hypothetical protein